MNYEYDGVVDNLARFGPTFQAKVLGSMLTSKQFLQQSLDVLNPKFFESDAGQWIVRTTTDYFAHYKTLPTLEVFKLELNSINDDVLKIAVKEQLRSAYQRKNDEDLEYVRNSFLEFAKNQALKIAIERSVDLLEIGKYDQIKTIIDTAMKAGQPRNIGHNWKEDVSLRMSGMSRICIPTGWEPIDILLGGGLGGGELGVIAAPSGIGKSWALATIGANAARLGKRVVHYTLELNENYVGLRYDTIFTGIEPGQLTQYPEMVHNQISSIPGELIIKYYAPRSTNVNNIRAHIDHLTTNGHTPDMILIDYADLMKSIDRIDTKYQELGAIYEEIRGMAGELAVPCWTASQTQRSSIQDEVIQADKIASSYEKIMTADVVVSLSRKLEDKVNNTGRAHVMKNRFGADGITFPVYMNTTIGKIEIYDENSSKGILLKKQMQAGEGLLKRTLAQKFAALHDELSDDE